MYTGGGSVWEKSVYDSCLCVWDELVCMGGAYMCGRSLHVWEESVCGSGFSVTIGFPGYH